LIARTPPLRGIARTPPLRGSFFIRWFANQEPRGRGPYLKNHPQNSSKFNRFGLCSSGRVLFLWVLGFQTTQRRNHTGGGFLEFDFSIREYKR